MYKMITLPYSFEDFPNHIGRETFALHYNVLYKGYVDKYNEVLNKLVEARKNNDYNAIKCLEHDLAFQGAGATLHSLYFENITPNKNEMSSNLENHIKESFGTVESFYEQFLASSANIEGSGWGILGYNKALDTLLIVQAEKHQNLTLWDFVPIMVIDMWEHAYYLDYGPNKKEYLKRMFQIINWKVIEKRLNNI